MSKGEHFGYKATDGERKNRFGLLIEEGKIYTAVGEIIPGQYSIEKMNGYHMSEPLANVFRYFDSETQGIEVAEVRGFGNCVKFDDEDYDYFDMYVCEHLEIIRFMKREEYIEKMLHQSETDIINFFRTFKLNEDEKELFSKSLKSYYSRARSALAYHQYGDKEIYNREARLIKKL